MRATATAAAFLLLCAHATHSTDTAAADGRKKMSTFWAALSPIAQNQKRLGQKIKAKD